MSTERILIHQDIFIVFKTALEEAMKHMAPTSQPPLVLAMPAGVERHRRLVAQASAAGAEIVGGEAAGQDDAEKQYRMRPALIVGADRSMDVYHEESFGPSVSLIQIDGEEEAIRITNDTEYGLSASVFTKDLRRALRLARRIQTGAVHVNSMTIHDDLATPHGGVKDSGWGRFNAQWGMEEFLKLKTVTFQ
jgi:acyl-CoA reductase-like NAD-dependent aldehyde dehydrogenase